MRYPGARRHPRRRRARLNGRPVCGFARAVAVSEGLRRCDSVDAKSVDPVLSVMPACARPGLGEIASAFSRCSVPVCV